MNRVFRAAVEQVVNSAESGRLRDRWRNRRTVGAFRTMLASPYLMDMVYDKFADEIESTTLDEAVAAIGDGAILDQLARYVKWIIEHADEIEAFLLMLLKIVAAIVAMFV